jgi:hypothetical protein
MHSAGTGAPDFQAILQEASDVEQCPTAGANHGATGPFK